MLIFKGVFSPILFNFQLVLYRFRDLPVSEAISCSTFLTPRKTWNNNPIHPSVRVVMLHFRTCKHERKKKILSEKQPLSGWGHDHPSSANVPWIKLRPRVPMCHTFIHRGSAFSIPGSFFERFSFHNCFMNVEIDPLLQE